MKESLEKELKSLSISELRDFLEYMTIRKKELFSPRLKYEKNVLPESKISSISLLKRWITGLTKKNNELRKTYYNDFMFYYDSVEEILNRKIEKIKSGTDKDILDDLNSKCEMYRSIIKLLGSDEDYLDRLGISKLLFEVKNSSDEKNINDNLNEYLSKLSKIGVQITIKDFDYIVYVNDYMIDYFNLFESDRKSLDEKLADMLEEYRLFREYLYLTLLNIAHKNKTILTEYLDKSINNKLANVQSDKVDIYPKYFKTRKEYINLLGNDNITIINYFKENSDELDIYSKDSEEIVDIISSISKCDIFKRYSNEERVFYTNNLIEFYWDLAEYKFVNDYKYLFNYGEILSTTKFKSGDFKSLLQAIETINKRLSKTNKKLMKERNKLNKVLVTDSSKYYVRINMCDKVRETLDELVESMIDLLSSYDNLKLVKNMHDNINDKSTVYDVLKVLNNNYNVLRVLASDNVDDLIEMEYFHHLSLLDNIFFKHITSIKYLIEQKYNLYNINVNIPDLDSEEFEELRENITILIRYLTLLNKGLSTEDIKIILNEED